MPPNLVLESGSGGLHTSLDYSINSSFPCHTCDLVAMSSLDSVEPLDSLDIDELVEEAVLIQDNDYSFPEDDYGLLNYAKLYLHLHNLNHSHQFNITTQILNYDTGFPSQYRTSEIILLCVVMTFMLVVVIIGNMLVIIAIATEHSLAGVQNWFIASLAFADLSIGLVVMPFTLANELLGYWMFGSIWCDIYSAMDVLLCTASITTICLISLDRYWSITKTIDYLNSRTPWRVTLYIVTVWLVSAFISLPPLLGWRKVHDLHWFDSLRKYQYTNNLSNVQFIQFLKKEPNQTLQTFTTTLEGEVFPQCSLSEDTGYVMYSAFGSFYIPTCIMVFVYIQIYFAARARARRNIKPNKNPHRREEYQMKKCGASKGGTACNGKLPTQPTTLKSPHSDKFTAREPNLGDIANGNRPGDTHHQDNGGDTSSKASRGEDSSDSEEEEVDQVMKQNSLGSLLRKVKQKNNMQDQVYTLQVDKQHMLKEEQGSRTNLDLDPSLGVEKLLEKNELSGQKFNKNHCNAAQWEQEDAEVPAAPDEEGEPGEGGEGGDEPFQEQKHNKLNGNGNAKHVEDDIHETVKGGGRDPPSPETERLKTKGDDESYYGESSTGSDSGKVRCVKIRSRILPKLTLGRRLSKETREMIDIGKLPAKNQPTSEVTQNQEKEKRRMARKKERRAFLILGLIMGAFIACWLPFFILYSISPLCPVCSEDTSGCCVQGWGFSFAFWLGYSNSALNPVIYTVFNKDFRRAFKKILFK